MAEIIQLSERRDGDGGNDPAPRRKLKKEPRGYLLVPARALDVVHKLEASVDDFVAGRSYAPFDLQAYFQLLALIELAAKYE
jgi:hypothetical protein